MEYCISDKVFKKCPRCKFAALIVTNLMNPKINQDHTYQFLCQQIDKARKEAAIKKQSRSKSYAPKEIVNWDETLEKIGIDPEKNKPSHKALWERTVENSEELPNINPLVNIYNAISIKHKVPIGGHDIANIKGPVTVGPNTKELSFTQMNTNKTEKIDKKEFVYADTEKIMTRNWVWRQSEQTKSTPNTKEIFIPIDTINRTVEEIENIAQEVYSAIKHFYPDAQAQLAIADAKEPKVTITREDHQNNNPKIKKLTAKPIDFTGYDISRDKRIINQILEKAVEDILPGKEKLRNLLMSGRRLKVYLGVDPTGPTLHVGHAVSMRRLELFRKLGHKVYLLIGDFTARIGDPDKLSTREPLTETQIKENLRLYKGQAQTFLDIDNEKNPIEIVFNNDWLGKMNFSDILNLASNFSVQQMLKKEMFQNRMKDDRPVYIHEFMYPIMQGFDNVKLEIDVQFGGNDQLFNMLAGRQLVDHYLGKENFIIAGKLLTSPDGTKMGKTTGNMIKLSDTPENIYGKVMSYPDEHIIPGFELLTSADMDEVAQIQNRLDSGENPMILKKELAHRITAEFKSKKDAEKAQDYFEKVFQSSNTETAEIPEISLDKSGPLPLLELLTDITGFAKSRGDARRLIEQGAVKIDDEKVEDSSTDIYLEESFVLRVGKKVAKISVS